MVHHGTGGRIHCHVADGESVFNHVLPRPEALQHNLMAAGNIGKQRYAFHHLSLGKVLQGHRHIIGRIDFDVSHRFPDFARSD